MYLHALPGLHISAGSREREGGLPYLLPNHSTRMVRAMPLTGIIGPLRRGEQHLAFGP